MYMEKMFPTKKLIIFIIIINGNRGSGLKMGYLTFNVMYKKK
jgi:hypothetical protein